jgi:hypothetical protein
MRCSSWPPSRTASRRQPPCRRNWTRRMQTGRRPQADGLHTTYPHPHLPRHPPRHPQARPRRLADAHRAPTRLVLPRPAGLRLLMLLLIWRRARWLGSTCARSWSTRPTVRRPTLYPSVHTPLAGQPPAAPQAPVAILGLLGRRLHPLCGSLPNAACLLTGDCLRRAFARWQAGPPFALCRHGTAAGACGIAAG